MTLIYPKHQTQSPNDFVGRASFIAHYARLAGIKVQEIEDTDDVWLQRKVRGKGWIHGKGNHLSCLYNGRRIIFELSDFLELGDTEQFTDPFFKFHYSRVLYGHLEHVFPVGPSMILPSGISTFRYYFSLRDRFKYNCSTDIISNRQEPRRLAQGRRIKVQNILQRRYGKNLDTNWKDTQKNFWTSNENCLVSVCVPGACNNMLDRGHYELIGLGVCTISPYIPTVLPWNKKLIPNEHYICCENDYSNIVEKVEWCRSNRKRCNEIGKNASALFDKYCTPTKYWEWIDYCLGKIK
jgi:hypothetical protein